MGGRGSGRKDRTTELLNQNIEKRSPIATSGGEGLFLPNVSNVSDFARKDRPNSSGLTTGSILFTDSVGQIAQDNTNLFWDNTNKRLRIGTGNAPIAPLDVMGNVRTLKLILSRGGIGIQEPFIEKTDNKGMGFFTLDNHRLNISVGGNFDFKAGNMVTTGNLNVNDATLSGQINLTDASINIITATNVNGDLRLGAGGGTNDLKIDKNGNVDIFENLTMGGAILGGGAGHDQFSDFVANEHINWTSTSNNLSTTGTAATGALTATGVLHTFKKEGDVEVKIDTSGGTNADSILSFHENTLDRGDIRWDGGTNDFIWTSSTGDINIMPFINMGVGTLTPSGKLHVDQSSTTRAIPVLYLDQADLSEEMIEFQTTIGTGNPIEAIAAKTLTTTHFIKITIPGGLTRYIPCGTIA